MRHLLLVLAASSLLAAADSTDTITVDGLPESIRNQLPQTLNGGVVVDVQVDRHNGQPQYIVRYHGQSTTEVQSVRLGQNGTVLNNGMLNVPSRDGTSGNQSATTTQTLPSASGTAATPTVPPLQSPGQSANGQVGTNVGGTTTTTIQLPPGASPTKSVPGSTQNLNAPVNQQTQAGTGNQNGTNFPNGANTLNGANIPPGANTVNGANIPAGANTVNGANIPSGANTVNGANLNNGANTVNGTNTQNNVNTQNNGNTQNGTNSQNGSNGQGGTNGSASGHSK